MVSRVRKKNTLRRKTYKRKTYKRNTHKRKTYKRKTYKRKTYKRRNYKRKNTNKKYIGGDGDEPEGAPTIPMRGCVGKPFYIVYSKTNDMEEGDRCKNCKVIFTMINRKHHCRGCVGIFCYNCSPKRNIDYITYQMVQDPDLDQPSFLYRDSAKWDGNRKNGPQRLCENCFNNPLDSNDVIMFRHQDGILTAMPSTPLNDFFVIEKLVELLQMMEGMRVGQREIMVIERLLEDMCRLFMIKYIGVMQEDDFSLPRMRAVANNHHAPPNLYLSWHIWVSNPKSWDSLPDSLPGSSPASPWSNVWRVVLRLVRSIIDSMMVAVQGVTVNPHAAETVALDDPLVRTERIEAAKQKMEENEKNTVGNTKEDQEKYEREVKEDNSCCTVNLEDFHGNKFNDKVKDNDYIILDTVGTDGTVEQGKGECLSLVDIEGMIDALDSTGWHERKDIIPLLKNPYSNKTFTDTNLQKISNLLELNNISL